jgi:hypothetical protein
LPYDLHDPFEPKHPSVASSRLRATAAALTSWVRLKKIFIGGFKIDIHKILINIHAWNAFIDLIDNPSFINVLMVWCSQPV